MELVQPWHIWLIVAVAFFVVEIFSNTFVFLCFSLGCLFSSICAYLGMGLSVQILVFSIITFLSFFTVRPLMKKYVFRKDDSIKTNTDALVGKTGRVTETIDYSKNTGRVFVYGDDWKAICEDDTVIAENEPVEVTKVDSTTLIVKPLK
ncbi:MAG: NfeD family protein [Bacteroidales bacterium]|jgi:membrane protein implicated in regulation of membrane protease activity|nr:NfeD family protein [Bacteroidales bacterium]